MLITDCYVIMCVLEAAGHERSWVQDKVSAGQWGAIRLQHGPEQLDLV